MNSGTKRKPYLGTLTYQVSTLHMTKYTIKKNYRVFTIKIFERHIDGTNDPVYANFFFMNSVGITVARSVPEVDANAPLDKANFRISGFSTHAVSLPLLC